MAHNINTYIGRQAAWHKLGTVTGHYMTWNEIQAHGGLNFVPCKQQLSNPITGELVDAWGIFRPDTGAFLGAVGEQYTIIDHAEGFRLIDALIGEQNGAHYETAGALGKGEVVWGLANLNMGIEVGASGDKHETYLLFATAHNGTFSHLYRTTFTRVVCQNTLNMALSSKATAQFRVRHNARAHEKLNRAHDALAHIGADVKGMEAKLNLLAARRMTRESTVAILDRLFPQRKGENGQPVDSGRRTNILGDILACYESNDRNTFPEQRGTAYNLLNAITEYTDHMTSTTWNSVDGKSAMFGSGDRLKTQALEVILETAKGLPVVETRRMTFTPNPVVAGVSLLDQIAATQN